MSGTTPSHEDLLELTGQQACLIRDLEARLARLQAEADRLRAELEQARRFSRPSRHMPFGTSSRAFGCPGAGGTFALGDPDEGLGLAYVTNQMGFQPFDDPREKAVRDACYETMTAAGGRERFPHVGRPSLASTMPPQRSA